MGIFELFSKRAKPLPDVFQYGCLPQKFRNQVLWEWKDLLLREGYASIRNILCREHGLLCLTSDHRPPHEDLLFFFQDHASPVDISLDAIELSLRLICIWTDERDFSRVSGNIFFQGSNDRVYLNLISAINHRFRENGIGYEYCAKSQQLIRINSLLVHQEAVLPALLLLSDPAFKTANEEFLKAHKDFRDGEYGDCLTACCAAFESTIKIICDQKRWGYTPTDAAGALVKVYMKESRLPPYFDSLLMIIATLRNKLGAHGKGTTPVVVPEYSAKYALHATASAIVLLVDHASTVR